MFGRNTKQKEQLFLVDHFALVYDHGIFPTAFSLPVLLINRQPEFLHPVLNRVVAWHRPQFIIEALGDDFEDSDNSAQAAVGLSVDENTELNNQKREPMSWNSLEIKSCCSFFSVLFGASFF